MFQPVYGSVGSSTPLCSSGFPEGFFSVTNSATAATHAWHWALREGGQAVLSAACCSQLRVAYARSFSLHLIGFTDFLMIQESLLEGEN